MYSSRDHCDAKNSLLCWMCFSTLKAFLDPKAPQISVVAHRRQHLARCHSRSAYFSCTMPHNEVQGGGYKTTSVSHKMLINTNCLYTVCKHPLSDPFTSFPIYWFYSRTFPYRSGCAEHCLAKCPGGTPTLVAAPETLHESGGLRALWPLPALNFLLFPDSDAKRAACTGLVGPATMASSPTACKMRCCKSFHNTPRSSRALSLGASSGFGTNATKCQRTMVNQPHPTSQLSPQQIH
jgi:hypothetical protein